MTRRSLPTLVLALVFLFLPALVAGMYTTVGGAGETLDTVLFVAGLLAAVAAVIFFGLALLMGYRRGKQVVPLRDTYLLFRYFAIGAGFFALSNSVALFRVFGAAGLIFPVMLAAYVAFALSSSARRQDYRVAIVVSSTPEAAFALVSEPRNWPRYLPQVESVEPRDVPLHAGSTIRYRVRAGQTLLEVEEVVIAFEPGLRFGTGLADPAATGIYELSAGPGGTVIAYSHSGQMPVAQSIITGVFGRKANLGRMIEARQTGMDAIKRLLEAQPAVTV